MNRLVILVLYGTPCLLLTIIPVRSIAEYSDSCSIYARQLADAADAYESKIRNFKSACDQYYGYMKDDEAACGSYGYERSGYDRAKRALLDAISSASSFCGMPDQGSPYVQALRKMGSELNDLKKQLADKEAELVSTKAQLETIQRK